MLRPAKTIEQRYEFIIDARNRLGYDPQVLVEDGWTITKTKKPEGKYKGAYLIGEKVIWEKHEAVVIAYLYETEGIGDLWKLIYIEDFAPFDLEADELQEGLKKMAKRESRRKAKQDAELQGYPKKTSSRTSRNKISVIGIEYGIVMAVSSSVSARSGVKWPARVLNVAEVEQLLSSSSRRSSAKNSVPVVFLAPYWNGASAVKGKASSATASNPFSSGPLFQLEYVEVTPENIAEYTHEKVSIDHMRTEFQFSGLPKPAFTRFVNAHRMAIAFRSYAKKHLVNELQGDNTEAIATLTDAHVMSVKSPLFPDAVLNLPYEYLLAQLPCPIEKSVSDKNEEEYEPAINFVSILDSMKPPFCFGVGLSEENGSKIIEQVQPHENAQPSPSPRSFINQNYESNFSLEKVASYPLLKYLEDEASKGASLSSTLDYLLKSLHTSICADLPNFQNRNHRVKVLNSIMHQCMMVKVCISILTLLP